MKKHTFFVQKIKLHEHIFILIIFLFLGALGIALTHHFLPAKESLLISAYAFAVFFVYYFIMLYRGVRYDNGYVQWKWGGLSLNDMISGIKEHGFDIGVPDFGIMDLGDSIIGSLVAFLASILLAIIIGIVVVVLLWFGINVIGFVVFLAWIPLYALARYGIRIALTNVRKTKNNFFASLSYALVNAMVAGVATFSSSYVIEKIIFIFHGKV